MGRMGAFVAAVAAVSAMTGAAAAQGRADFTEVDDGRAVKLFSPEFTVDLPRNAGTGYHWEFATRNSRGVVLVSKLKGRAPPHGPGIVGYPETDRFVLRAVAPDGEVRIGLLRPGRYDGPERVFRLAFRSGYADAPPPGRYYSPAPRSGYEPPQPRPYGHPPG